MITVQQLILDLLPFAIGVFASPLPVIIAIVMLFTPAPRPTSIVYVVTWVLGLTVATLVFVALARFLQDARGDGSWGTYLRIVAGLALLVMAVRMWQGRDAKQTPAWLTSLMESGPKQAVRYGVLMSAANPKELLMALAAGLTVAAAGVSPAQATVSLAVFVAVGAASVVAPLVVFLLGGQSTLRALSRAREWLQRNNAAVAAVVLGFLGLWLAIGGLLKL